MTLKGSLPLVFMLFASLGFACDFSIGQGNFPYTASSPGEYCLTGSVTVSNQNAFTVNSDNVSLNCVDHWINTTTGGYGFASTNHQNLLVDNCNFNTYGTTITSQNDLNLIVNNTYIISAIRGISFSSTNDSIISDSVVISTSGYEFVNEAINLINCHNNTVSGTVAISPGTAFQLHYANNNTITTSTLIGGKYGVEFGQVENNIGTSDGNNFITNTINSTTGVIFMESSSDNTILNNIIISSIWVNDTVGGNFFNDTTSGNIYYTSNGTPAYSIYNITCSFTTPCYADGGVDVPFSSSLAGGVWVGSGEDWHPYSYYAASPAQIEYCGASNATAVTWIAYDLLTNTLIPFNVTTTIQQIVGSSLIVGNFTGVGNSTENFSLCVNPGYGTVYAQLSDTVASVGYSPIQWTHLAQNYTNDTSVYSIYMLPSAGNNTKLVQIYVVDSTFTPMLNVSVKIQQMNPITSAIILLGSFLVDSFGSTTQALQPATQLYHFTVITPSGTVLQDYNNQAIPCTSAELICKMVLVVKGNNVVPVVPAVNGTGTGYVGSTAFGRDAWLAAILLVVVAATLMTGNMAVSMILGVFGLFTALAFGIIPLADAPVAVLFAIIALVIAYRLRI